MTKTRTKPTAAPSATKPPAKRTPRPHRTRPLTPNQRPGSARVRRGHATQAAGPRGTRRTIATSARTAKNAAGAPASTPTNWNIEKAGYELTPAVAQDAIRLAENCDFELMLSADCPELGPKFEPHRIAFNGRGDAADDFTYPPDLTDPRVSNFLGNRGKCRTECRDYDTLVSTVLLSVKHHLGKKAYVTSNAEPDREGWQAAFELYSRTFPEREIPWLNNWPR